MYLYICSERNKTSSVIPSLLLMDEAMARVTSCDIVCLLYSEKRQTCENSNESILQIKLNLIFISEL